MTATPPAEDAGPGSTRAGAPTGIDAQPEDEYFDLMASVAEAHWWYRGRRALVAQTLRRRIGRGTVALDVGCGTSETLDVLTAIGARIAIGTDLSEAALAYASSRRPRPEVLRALAEHLPLRDGSVGCLVSMDVIEHLDDDVVALREYVRVLEPGAVVLLTVPAYEFLWGEHDERAFHRRRYTARHLRDVAEQAGVQVDRVTYYYSFLLPGAFLVRRTPLKRLVKVTDDEAAMMHPSLEAAFTVLAWLERQVARLVRIPFGLSILLVGRSAASE